MGDIHRLVEKGLEVLEFVLGSGMRSEALPKTKVARIGHELP